MDQHSFRVSWCLPATAVALLFLLPLAVSEGTGPLCMPAVRAAAAEIRHIQGEAPRSVGRQATPLPGTLIVCDSRGVVDEVRQRFVSSLGASQRAFVHIIAGDASGQPGTAWDKLGATSAGSLAVGSREGAAGLEASAALNNVSAVWIDGSAADVTRLLASTPLAQRMQEILRSGGTVGGAVGGLGLAGRISFDAAYLEKDPHSSPVARLAADPGYFGLGIAPTSGVVIAGRRIRTVGDGGAVTCLPASTRRPALFAPLSGRGDDIVRLSRAAIARCGPPFPPDPAAVPHVERGTLVICGGGGMPEEVWKRFVESAGGAKARLVVLATAAGDQVPANPREVRRLRGMGVADVVSLPHRSASEIASPEFVETLRKATGIWFSGGRQWRFVDAYEDTVAEELFRDVLRRGGVIGGSSAGASIQAQYMVRGSPNGNQVMMAEGYEQGLGFLPGVAVDQHFTQRNRFADMTSLMQTFPQLLGIGIDESTAVIVEGHEMKVVGANRVCIYDTQHPPADDDQDFLSLPAGSRYDLKARRRLP